MKFILILATFLVLWDVSHACLNPCNGVTAATCTAPCFTCGLCSAKCCQSLFGRTEIDRFLLPCLSGREDDEVTSDLDPALNELEMQSFAVCNNDGEPGLTWDEVDLCVVRHTKSYSNSYCLKYFLCRLHLDTFSKMSIFPRRRISSILIPTLTEFYSTKNG